MATLTRATSYAMGLDWNDTQTAGNNLPNGATSPTLTAITTNVSGMSYAVNDLGHFAIQLPHNAAPGTDVRLHCHFTFPSQPTAGRTVRWEVYYSIGAINAAFGAESAVQHGEYTIQATDDKYHRVQAICTVSGVASAHSAAVIGRIKRVASTGTESDVNPILLFVDGHYQMGSFGTETEHS